MGRGRHGHLAARAGSQDLAGLDLRSALVALVIMQFFTGTSSNWLGPSEVFVWFVAVDMRGHV